MTIASDPLVPSAPAEPWRPGGDEPAQAAEHGLVAGAPGAAGLPVSARRADDPGPDPDVSRRALRARPLAFAVLGVAALAFLLWLTNRARGQPQLVVALALVLVSACDAVLARRTLRAPRLEIHHPTDAVAGGPVALFVRMPDLVRPVRLRQAGVFGARPVVLENREPGVVTVPAPGRSVVPFVTLDLEGAGPLGLFESARRVRVWFPAPMYVGPPALEHPVDWPRMQTLRWGDTETSPSGHDLFRSVRPYVRGDPRRSVHWPATAHHRALMVKETDGTGVVAIRIVVHLPFPGPAAEVTAGRAAWMAEQSLARGWMVHLVTVEAASPPPPPPALRSPSGPVPVLLPPTRVVTVDRRVTTPHAVNAQLASAAYGVPALGAWRGLTRVVSPQGDVWR